MGEEQKMATPHKKRIGKWRLVALLMMAYDIVAVNAAYFFALWIRFDCRYTMIPSELMTAFFTFLPFYSIVVLGVFRGLRLYNSVWRFASFHELLCLIGAWIITTVFHVIGITVFLQRMPIAYYLIGAIVQLLLTTAIRFAYRFFVMEKERIRKQDTGAPVHNIMLIGAGSAGQIILRDIQRARETRAVVCCIIDDDENTWTRYIEGVPVVGGRDDILVNAEKYHIDQIMFAIPTADAGSKRDILNICKETGCEIKVLPGIYQLVNGEVSLSKMKDVDVVDLLGREPIKVNMQEIFGQISGKTILVTGGGGSIGSELCRQIADHKPRLLIIFDIYENNAYNIEQELRMKHSELNLRVLIGSVRDSRRIESIFEQYHPDIVYHAAAHKHVPLMEASPCESIKNNVVGTYKTAFAAMKYGCKRFVLISTDKAVNPANIMGASKRLCEMVIQTMDKLNREHREYLLPHIHGHLGSEASMHILEDSRTEFVAVRFGNVLGSNGSVIPLFKKQIAEGGPVTVTHPDIIRYFMTIPEAVSLVLQAGCYAKGGEIFVLDMGEPMKIDTLARNLIKLSGFRPDIDIPIIYTGLRPGEKLYEEKLMDEEGLLTTPNHLIHIGKPIPINAEDFIESLQLLADSAYKNNPDIEKMVEAVVKTFKPAGKNQQTVADMGNKEPAGKEC